MSFYVLLQDILDAGKSLIRRPLRSLLSSLGIGIGVTALIAMLSISEGAKQSALRKIRSLGTGTLRVEHSQMTAIDERSFTNLSQGIVQEDVEHLAQWLGSRGKVGAYVKRDNLRVKAGSKSSGATVLGVNAEWFGAENVRLARGRFLDRTDIKAGSNFCVIGSRLASELQVGIGGTIQHGGFPTIIVGILQPKGRLLTEGTGLSAFDFDRIVVLPVSTVLMEEQPARRLIYDGLVITLNDEREVSVQRSAVQIQSMLFASHRRVENFIVVVPVTLLKKAQESQKVFSLVMGTIAGLSLIVGGIGVMNVMLANIAEQTREIGLRMAVGASRRRIIWLYIWHSVLLTLSGGLWGIITGVLFALIIERYAGWDMVFSTFSLIVAPLSAILAGVIFGVHPAIRAASFNPAIALRET